MYTPFTSFVKISIQCSPWQQNWKIAKYIKSGICSKYSPNFNESCLISQTFLIVLENFYSMHFCLIDGRCVFKNSTYLNHNIASLTPDVYGSFFCLYFSIYCSNFIGDEHSRSPVSIFFRIDFYGSNSYCKYNSSNKYRYFQSCQLPRILLGVPYSSTSYNYGTIGKK